MEIEPQSAEVVKTIFRLYKEHYAFKGIAKYLNDNNVPTSTGHLWSWTQVQDILHNKLYIGIYELGKKSNNIRAVSPVMEHLKIISENEFYEVQELIKKNIKCTNFTRPTIRGSRLLTGLLYCECGNKYTSQTNRAVRHNADGSDWVYERTTYRCGSYRTPKNGQCSKLPIKADVLDNLVVHDVKNFLRKTDIENLLQLNDNGVKKKVDSLSEQLKRLLKDKTQLEKELQKLSEEVCKVIMGESQWSQAMLSKLIETKEQELSEIKKKQEELEIKISELSTYLSAKKETCSDFEDWGEKFDLQDTATKKSMLINAIDKITVYDDKVTVKMKFNCDYFKGGSEFDIENAIAVNELPAGFFPSEFVQGKEQPRRAILSLSGRLRKIHSCL